jgi:hypothetical protein
MSAGWVMLPRGSTCPGRCGLARPGPSRAESGIGNLSDDYFRDILVRRDLTALFVNAERSRLAVAADVVPICRHPFPPVRHWPFVTWSAFLGSNLPEPNFRRGLPHQISEMRVIRPSGYGPLSPAPITQAVTSSDNQWDLPRQNPLLSMNEDEFCALPLATLQSARATVISATYDSYRSSQVKGAKSAANDVAYRLLQEP